MKLPDRQRAQLATNLLTSLPSAATDPDEGVTEALRHDAEIDDGTRALSLEDIEAAISPSLGSSHR